MINTDRIVPVQVIDLLSLYGLVLKQDTTNNSGLVALSATTPEVFTQSTNSAVAIAAEPLKSLNFASGVSAGTVYFVPAFDYVGFSINGVAEAAAAGSDAVVADGRTLYKAVLSSGDITITKCGF
jgi:hypothetical protein